MTKGQLLKLPKNHPKNRILTFFIFLIRIQILFLVLWYINTVRSLQTVKVEKNCHWIVTKTGTHSLYFPSMWYREPNIWIDVVVLQYRKPQNKNKNTSKQSFLLWFESNPFSILCLHLLLQKPQIQILSLKPNLNVSHPQRQTEESVCSSVSQVSPSVLTKPSGFMYHCHLYQTTWSQIMHNYDKWLMMVSVSLNTSLHSYLFNQRYTFRWHTAVMSDCDAIGEQFDVGGCAHE